MTTTELVHVEPLLPMDPQTAREAMTKYRELTEAMLTPDDWQTIPNGRFVKRSGFQKIASGYGVSIEILAEDVERDDKGQPVRASATVRATHPSGRFADGSGRCSIDETRFRTPSGRAKAEHDVAATAVTRATNRAISNLVGFGQVSAEEVDGAAPSTGPVSEFGAETDAETEKAAAAVLSRLYPHVPGDQLVALVNRQLHTTHLPQASVRMINAIDWALGDERMRTPTPTQPPAASPEGATT